MYYLGIMMRNGGEGRDMSRNEGKITELKENYKRAIESAEAKDWLNFGKFICFSWRCLADAYDNNPPQDKVDTFKSSLLADVETYVPHMRAAVEEIFTFFDSVKSDQSRKRKLMAEYVGFKLQRAIGMANVDLSNPHVTMFSIVDAKFDEIRTILAADIHDLDTRRALIEKFKVLDQAILDSNALRPKQNG